MAIQGDLCEPVANMTVLDLVAGIPVGDLIDTIIVDSVDRISSIAINRFPVPPTAGGFLIDLSEIDPDLVITGSRITRHLVSAINPESAFLEATIGQIWPR